MVKRKLEVEVYDRKGVFVPLKFVKEKFEW